jgi:hypothetical protein
VRSSLSLTTPQASRAAHVPRGPPHPNLIGPSRQGHAVLPGNRNMRRRAEGPQSPAGELGLWWRSPRIGPNRSGCGDAKWGGRVGLLPSRFPMRARPLARAPEWYTRGVRKRTTYELISFLDVTILHYTIDIKRLSAVCRCLPARASLLTLSLTSAHHCSVSSPRGWARRAQRRQCSRPPSPERVAASPAAANRCAA